MARLLGCGPRARKSASPPKSADDDQLPTNLAELQFNKLKYLAHKHPSIIHSEQLDKKTRVWLAAEIGSTKEVERAYAAGEITMQDKSPEGHRLIHVCAAAGSIPLVRLLLEHGEQINATNETGETPVFLAANGGHSGLVKALIAAGADANAPNIYAETPIYMACYHGHVDVIRVLVRVKGIQLSAANEEGIQPIDVARRYAVSSPQHKTILLLMEQAAAWSKIRLVLLGNRKNKDNPNCPFRLLSPFATKQICTYLAKTPPKAAKSPSPPRVVEDFL